MKCTAQKLKSHCLIFHILSRLVLTRSCGRWHVKSRKLSVFCGITNRNLWLLGKGDFLRNFGGNYQRKFSVYKWCILFSETGCILRGKVPVFVANMNRVALGSCRRNSTRQTSPQLRSHEWRCTKILRIPLISESYKNCCYV